MKIISKKLKLTWEIVGVYRDPNEDIRVLERLVFRTGGTSNTAKRSIIGGDLNLPQVDWDGRGDGNNLTQALINSLVWVNGFSQVVKSLTTCTWFDLKVHTTLVTQYRG